jgi:hypothetical protein
LLPVSIEDLNHKTGQGSARFPWLVAVHLETVRVAHKCDETLFAQVNQHPWNVRKLALFRRNRVNSARFLRAFRLRQCLFVVDGMLSLAYSATPPSGDDQVVAQLA